MDGFDRAGKRLLASVDDMKKGRVVDPQLSLSTSSAGPLFALSESSSMEESKRKELNRLDEVFKLVAEKVSQKTGLAPVEPPKNIIPVELMPHQKEALGWLVDRENSSELPPFWLLKDNKYVNVVTGFETENHPQPLRGGIFADEIGLGKTLTLLSLIALDKCDDGECINVDHMEESDTLNTILPGVQNFKKQRTVEPRKESHSGKGKETETETKTTLVVCPLPVISIWVSQLSQHTREGSLKVYMHHRGRTKDVEELKKFDIVLTTYSALAREVKSSGSPLTKVKWWRVILDETQLIEHVNTQHAKAVTFLQSDRRWAVIGTPIHKKALFALMTFLRYEPFSDQSCWNNLIQHPLDQGQSKGWTRLQTIMATICWSRTKDKVLMDLPPKVIEICFIELSSEEQELYEQVEGERKNLLSTYINTGNITQNCNSFFRVFRRFQEIACMVKPLLCPEYIKSLILSTKIEDVSNDPELLAKMVALLQESEDLNCPICLSHPSKAVITCCAHIFCGSCILEILKHVNSCCPMCRHPLTESDLFTAPRESLEFGIPPSPSSSKISMSSKGSLLLNLLKQSKEENPTAKSVVFSLFRKMLLLLVEPLRASGFKVLYLDWIMTNKKIACLIEQFSDEGSNSPTILLASLNPSFLDINLTAASTVYILEPWWNPAIDEKVLATVHRIGQKETVKVVRLVNKNTIEERVLALQERNRIVAREGFQRKNSMHMFKTSIDHVRDLMLL